MKIPEKARQERLVDYAERLSELYTKTYNSKIRKLKGQFFTPKQVSSFMANLFNIQNDVIRLLDPGAGIGILSAAFCEQLFNVKKPIGLTIDAYENDPKLLPLLKKVLELCKIELESIGHNVEYNIYKQDFILHNEKYLRKSDLFWINNNCILYDFVISNPPYYKLNKDSPQSIVMMELVSGQPNIYALFMALSAKMVKPDGQMIFITPRSFCSGLYYKRFIEWFLSNVQITNIHIFKSRREVFDYDKILQENIIIKSKKVKKLNKLKRVTISTSENKNFTKIKKIKVRYSDIVSMKNGKVYIRIPTSSLDVDILKIVDKWKYTLKDLEMEISTGPVVPFRAEQYLLPKILKISKSVPLLWMHNMKDMKVVWPLKKNKKACAIQECDDTTSLLLLVKDYVLVKRFSSKEQKRRLYAAVLLESEFRYRTVGIENHVNYIHRPRGELSINEAFGIAALLNTSFIDNYFRSLNGNTQVNATDIRVMPFPTIKELEKVGKKIYESQHFKNGSELDEIVGNALGIESQIIKRLNRGEFNNGKD